MMNRLRSGGECWQKRVWLAMMLLLGAICPGLVHAQFQRLWETRTNLLFNGGFHHGNYYAPAVSNADRTVTLYQLASTGTLIPLWNYTEPAAYALYSYPNLDVDSAAERIFLRVIWSPQRVDLWALGLDGTFRWVIHSTPSLDRSYYAWLEGDGGGGVYEQVDFWQPWVTVIKWYTPNDGTLGWSYSRAGRFITKKDPLNRLLITLPIVANNQTVGFRFEWYIMPGNLVRVMEWRPGVSSLERRSPILFDAMGNLYLVVVFSGSGDTYLLSISPEGQIRWLQRVPAPPSLPYSRGFYYSPSDHSLLLFRLTNGATRQVEMDKFSADTGEMIQSRTIYQTAREEIDAVPIALDERFLYMAVHEGHLEEYCDYEGCDYYFVLDEVILLRFDLDGELLAHMRFSDSEYVSRIESVQGNLWLFHSSLGAGRAISCYKPLAARADGDIDGNGCVDDSDLLQLLFAFGQTGTDLPEDINQDGVVDDADLMRVLFAFGFGC